MRTISPHLHHHCLFIILTSIIFTISPVFTIDLLTPTQSLTANQTLDSKTGFFELTFFSPPNTNNWYIGISCKRIETQKTVVWVGNRDSPLRYSPGSVRINPNDGNINLLDSSGKIVWSTNHSSTPNTVAELIDSGNLVLRYENDENPDNYLWQSFDYPTDTLLPGMKLGWDSKSGLNRYITSWRTPDDPSTGNYSFKLDIDGDPEIYLNNGNVTDYRSGPWNGLGFSGSTETGANSLFIFQFVQNQDEIYYSFNITDHSVYSRLVMLSSGFLKRYVWNSVSNDWITFWYAPKDQCDDYRVCGVNGICDTNASPICKCLKGFEPKNLQAWNLRDGSEGCVRTKSSKLNCGSDGFLTMENVKLPESGTAFVDKNMGLTECGDLCRKNCSCRGYSSVNVTGADAGCVIWLDELYDMREYALAEGGQSFYLRVAKADLAQTKVGGFGHGSNNTKIIVASATSSIAVFLIALVILFIWKRRKPKKERISFLEHRGKHKREKSQDAISSVTIINRRDYSGETVDGELDLPVYDYDTIVLATDRFSDENKLGQGGFGSVYKGTLGESAAEVAVKRLSKNSGQGMEEFKNEVKLIARLQHRNLVRLVGCCVEMDEKILIYEYMENKSLDAYLFQKEKSLLLNWQIRFNVICGIARGLLYLHQDSRFRIIHRDLKASNILLDKEMIPKISDFGMARIFGGDQTESVTRKVVGTYGYMAPEYAMDGLFSIKSDVFSFGVLVMEIVSGMRNRGFYQTNNQLNLLAYAWKCYTEGNAMEIVDSTIGESYSTSEVARCIQVGLLCVQENAEDRPNMSNVVLMLSGECSSMPQPKNPGYCLGRRPTSEIVSSSPDDSCTANQITITMMDGR